MASSEFSGAGAGAAPVVYARAEGQAGGRRVASRFGLQPGMVASARTVTSRRSKADSLRLVQQLKRALVVGAIGGFTGLSGLVGARLSATATASASTSTSSTSTSSSGSTGTSGYFGQPTGGSSLGNTGSTATASGAVSSTGVS